MVAGMETVEKQESPLTVTDQLFDEIVKEISRLERQLKPILVSLPEESSKEAQPQTVLIGRLIAVKNALNDINKRIRL